MESLDEDLKAKEFIRKETILGQILLSLFFVYLIINGSYYIRFGEPLEISWKLNFAFAGATALFFYLIYLAFILPRTRPSFFNALMDLYHQNKRGMYGIITFASLSMLIFGGWAVFLLYHMITKDLWNMKLLSILFLISILSADVILMLYLYAKALRWKKS